MASLLVAVVAAGGTALGAARAGAAQPAYRVNPVGPRVEVTVSGGCPKSVAGYVTVANPGGGSAVRLAPRLPLAGLICRYGALGEKRYRDVRVGEAAARRLVAAADRLSLTPSRGVYSCPADFGSVSVLAFAYPGHGRAALWYEDSGCQTVDNGRIAAAQAGHPAFGRFSGVVDQLAPPESPSGGSTVVPAG